MAENIFSSSVGNNSSEEQQEYKQFDDCDQDCIYKDTSGQCIFETCMWDNEFPPSKGTWGFTCQICGKKTSKATRAVKILICDDCLQRLRRSASCKECGNSPL